MSTVRIFAAIALGALALTGCSGAPEPSEAYPPFSEVDPYTSEFFIALEDTSLVESQGEERLYNLGLNSCRFLDRGDTIAREWAALAVESNLGLDPAGRLIVASVQDLCPQHEDSLRQFVDGGAQSDVELARQACALEPELDSINCSHP